MRPFIFILLFAVSAFILLFAVSAGISAQSPVPPGLNIKFTQAWVWEYDDNHGKPGEMVIYYAPSKNYWLFTAEAYGVSGEMINWVLGKPDGTYLFNVTDEFGRMCLDTQRLDFVELYKLPSYYKPTGKRQSFGDKKFGFPLIEGKEFSLQFEKTIEKSLIYLSAAKKNMLPVYNFNRLTGDAKLPVHFDPNLPAGIMLLSEQQNSASGTRRLYRFKYISHTEYYI